MIIAAFSVCLLVNCRTCKLSAKSLNNLAACFRGLMACSQTCNRMVSSGRFHRVCQMPLAVWLVKGESGQPH